MSASIDGEVRPVAPGTAVQPGDPGTTSETGGPGDSSRPTSVAGLAQRLARGNVVVVVGAFVFAFIIGSVLILVSDAQVRTALGYFFARPADTFSAGWSAISEAYAAMFRGSIFDYRAFGKVADDLRARGGSGTYVLLPALARGFKPLLETLTVATPLIIASVGMAVSFRSGLFNIGGTGQLIVGASAAGYVGFAVPMPPVIHLIVCLVVGIVAGGVYGGIAGYLKARFGSSEVISTIMLNWIATYGLAFALTTSAFTGSNKAQPTSPSVLSSARLPLLAGEGYRLHLGLLIALASIVFLWWLMSRSTIGFRFRAVGSNPRAAEVAGIDVGRSAIGVMFVAGALVGLAGAVHVLGTEHRLTGSIAGSIGFDAITVALLGRSGPIGILLAGILFAALSTGGRFMETSQGVPIDLVQVIQALVVLFIAAPPLVRFLLGLRRVDQPGRARRVRRAKPAGEARPGTDVETPGADAPDGTPDGTASEAPSSSGDHPDPDPGGPPASAGPPASSRPDPDASDAENTTGGQER
ncbi:ABC transporter permease [Brachybacterium halotolerans subsp. kimchii]|uniref:ABC transporter permease n=1 Tax=Brachybacterium halotolerans TaxID=2795215 RepID=UPI001E5C89DE|nr:ABC transporter permease [Brachybacterium halotolerans]UEJ82530.1 ABC transporter permease [Brachybacterium halotolerans subsp. kimchii]